MSETAPVTPDVFHPATIDLDNRFLQNFGGDGSNALSRQIYELIPFTSEEEPDLTLELYSKFNAQITDQRELHGNLILNGKFNDADTVYMGFLFSPDPVLGQFDGLQVKTSIDTKSSATANPVFVSSDIWTKSRPFTDANFQASTDLTKDESNQWNITGEKSTVNCDAEGFCTIKAHFNRKFDTEDKEDHQLEHGKYLGYDIIGYYQIDHHASNSQQGGLD